MTSFYNPLLLLSLVIGASAQTLGQDVCVCSPGAYGITLDFSLVCPPTDITVSDPGIRDTSCLISQFGSPGATDLVPASVDRIDVLEIREDSTLILRSEITGPFSDGDTITYTTNPISSTASRTDIPFGIQFNTHAFNAAGEPLLNVLSIEYTNECDVYPVIREDQTAGWLRFTTLDPPQSGLCPAAETPAPTDTLSTSPTPAPTVTGSSTPTVTVVTANPTRTPATVITPSPTMASTDDQGPPPTEAPVAAPTEAPVASPTEAPVAAPTEAPVASPTEAPVAAPTEAPVASPTEAPVASPTEAPVAAPTEAPVASPTEAPVASPTEAPVASPTDPPVDPPVPAPTTAPRPTSPSADMPSADMPSADMPVDGGMSMSMILLDMEEMLDMEDKLEEAVHHYEEFGMGHSMDGSGHSKTSSKSAKKSNKKSAQTRNVSAPSSKSSSSESYRYTKKYSKRS